MGPPGGTPSCRGSIATPFFHQPRWWWRWQPSGLSWCSAPVEQSSLTGSSTDHLLSGPSRWRSHTLLWSYFRSPAMDSVGLPADCLQQRRRPHKYDTSTPCSSYEPTFLTVLRKIQTHLQQRSWVMNKASVLQWHHKSSQERCFTHNLCHYCYYYGNYYHCRSSSVQQLSDSIWRSWKHIISNDRKFDISSR